MDLILEGMKRLKINLIGLIHKLLEMLKVSNVLGKEMAL